MDGISKNIVVNTNRNTHTYTHTNANTNTNINTNKNTNKNERNGKLLKNFIFPKKKKKVKIKDSSIRRYNDIII